MNISAKRNNFTSIQSSQFVPLEHSAPIRVRTGYETVIPHICGQPFATIASEDGVIEEINEELQIVKVKYKSGKEECISYAKEYTNNSGQGFHVPQNLQINNFKTGDKVKKGDVIVYNSDFFSNNPYDKQVDMKLGVPTTIAFIESEGNLDDASVISTGLANKLKMRAAQEITLILTKDTQIYECVEVGDNVLATDTLMTFDQNPLSEEDEDKFGNDSLIDVLNTISRVKPKAKYSGTVSNIKVYFKCPISDMSKSMAQYVRKWIKLKNARAKYANDLYKFPASEPLKSDKVGSVLLTEDTVIVKFIIEQEHGVGDGDKIFVCSQNKSIISDVVDNITTEDGREVEIIHSAKGVAARIVNSPYLVICANEIMKKLQDDLVDLYFND